MATELPIRKRTRRRAAASEAAPAATIKHAATAVAEHERAASTEAEGSVTGAAATNALAKKASGKPMSRPRKHAPKASTRIASRATGKPSGSERTTPSHRKRPAAGSRASTIDAVGAFTQLVVEASESTLAANPLLGAESRDVGADQGGDSLRSLPQGVVGGRTRHVRHNPGPQGPSVCRSGMEEQCNLRAFDAGIFSHAKRAQRLYRGLEA